MCPALFQMTRAACFLRAYAGAPVTRTLRSSLLRCGERPYDTLRAHPENAARYRCAAPLLFTSCGSGVRGIPPVRWVARWFSVCAPCLANCGGGGLSRFSVLPGGWCFVCGAGEGCRLLAFCLLANLVRAEVSVPSVATSGCPKRSEGGCPCRSEDVHRTSSQQCGRLKAYESPPPSQDSSGHSPQKVTRLQDRPNPRHKLTEILNILTLLQQASAKTSRNLSIILKRQTKRAAIH